MSVELYQDAAMERQEKVQWFSFSGGERHVKILNTLSISVKDELFIKVDYKSSDDVMDLLLLTDAIRGINPLVRLSVYIPYMPYARQDRRCESGEAHSLRVFTSIINSQRYDQIIVEDPHSDVVEALFPTGVLNIIPQAVLLHRTLQVANFDSSAIVLVAPDGGALKKIYKCAEYIGTGEVVCAEKMRDTKTGEIIGTKFPECDMIDKDVLIVDDICDGGRTFVELAKVIRKQNPDISSLNLYVTHGIFSQGFGQLYQYFDNIFCSNKIYLTKE